MKIKSVLFILAIAGTTSLFGCKALAKKAAKRWAKKKRTEFLTKCNDSNAVKFMSDSEGFCDCALDIVMDKYPDPEEGLALKVVEVIKMTKDCVQN
jgi:hypothetical protein